MTITPPRASPSPTLLGRTISTPTHTLLLVAPLGAGSYGGVYSALDLRSGQHFAVKHVDTSRLSPQQTAMQRQEPLLHSKCVGHPGVLPLHDSLDVDNGWCLVLGHAESGDLFDAVTGGTLWRDCRTQAESEERSKAVFAQVCEAVAHCHASGVYHRDLKPENILLSWESQAVEAATTVAEEEGETTEEMYASEEVEPLDLPSYGRWPERAAVANPAPKPKHPHVWLSDFGLATECPIAAERGCGSAYYMAPESNLSTLPPRYTYISAAADVWSLGVLLANLASRRNPWQRAVHTDPMYARFLRHRAPALARSLHVSRPLAAILARVFSEDPRKRPSVLELRDLVLNVRSFAEGFDDEDDEEEAVVNRVPSPIIPKKALHKEVGEEVGHTPSHPEATTLPRPTAHAEEEGGTEGDELEMVEVRCSASSATIPSPSQDASLQQISLSNTPSTGGAEHVRAKDLEGAVPQAMEEMAQPVEPVSATVLYLSNFSETKSGGSSRGAAGSTTRVQEPIPQIPIHAYAPPSEEARARIDGGDRRADDSGVQVSTGRCTPQGHHDHSEPIPYPSPDTHTGSLIDPCSPRPRDGDLARHRYVHALGFAITPPPYPRTLEEGQL